MNVAHNFTWGHVVTVHEIGEYQIVEYREGPTNMSKGGNTMFHPYIDNKDTNCSCDTLDEALVKAIAIKHDGHNTRADGYFMKMIGA